MNLQPFKRLFETLILWGTVAVTVLVGVPLAVHLAAVITPTGFAPYRWWLPALLPQFLQGAPVPASTLWCLVGIVAAEILVGVIVAVLWRRSRRHGPDPRKRDAARQMNRRRNVGRLREKPRAEEAARLHPTAEAIAPGLTVGTFVNRRNDCAYQGWRECGLYIYSTGRGKTFGEVVPHMLEAPGAAMMTSNKPDGVKEVLAGRTGNGTRKAHILDPGGIYTDGEPSFIIDILGQVHTIRDARELAMILEDSNVQDEEAGKGGDKHFDPQGRALLAGFLLAAASDTSRTTTPEMVFEWLATMDAKPAIALLTAAGHTGTANKILGVTKQPERAMGSVFAVAQRMGEALADDDMLRWATPNRRLPVFDVDAFLRSRDTLILLSRDDDGPAGALVAALVRMVCKTAEAMAYASPTGRLPVPFVGEIDELANIVRWRSLPSVVSYYGSLGIIINSYLQSYEQGVGLYGEKKMDAFRDACAVRVYGGGSNDTRYLENLTKLIGKHDQEKVSVSTGRGGRSTSISNQRELLLDVDDLANLPEWHAILFSTKARPAYIRTCPWWERPELADLITTNQKDHA